ncbi:hypothetical protein Q5P01_010558 [Channa striata]|uniref:Uncharacterized protein n=1 Tax=Channa striata TaxID=64152 RepID=A0AA88MXY3_CHASR|nr:hypothetical protein Q5P01_010558 [Channa striata]
MRGEAMPSPATHTALLRVAEGGEDCGVDEDGEDGDEETAAARRRETLMNLEASEAAVGFEYTCVQLFDIEKRLPVTVAARLWPGSSCSTIRPIAVPKEAETRLASGGDTTARRRKRQRGARMQDELNRCKHTLQEAEEESARCREHAVKRAKSRDGGLIRQQNKWENALVEERDGTSHRVVQLQRVLHPSLMDRSIKRVKRIFLRDCVRKTVLEDGSAENRDHVTSMDMGGSSELFHEYESMIRQTVRTLDVEHSPMEYDDSCHHQTAHAKRRYRMGMKCRNPRKAKDEHGKKGEHESHDLKCSTSSSTTPTKLPKVEKAKQLIDARVPIQERGTCKREKRDR